MKQFIIFLIFLCLSFFVNAQKSKADTTKILKLIVTHFMDRYDNPNYGLQVADSVIELSKAMNYLRGIAEGYAMKAECYWVKGDYANSMYNTLLTINIYKRLHDQANIAMSNGPLALLYFELGDTRRSINYYLELRKFLFSSSDTINIVTFQLPREDALYLNDLNLAQAYLQANQVDSAFYFIQRVIKTDSVQNDYYAYATYVTGDIYAKMGMDSAALAWYNRETKRGSRNDNADINNGKALVFKKLNQFDSCRYAAKKALDTAQLIGYTKAVMRAAELIAFTYEQTNPAEFIKYLKLSNAAKDSLYSKEKINLVNSFILNNEIRQRDADEAETKFNYQKKIFLLIAVSVVFLVAGILLWRNNQHKKKSNSLLQTEKQKVEETLEELRETQQQLIHSEKMASLGELTAGIAHEIQNPLNFVNNFSEVNKEMLVEMKEEMDKGNLEDAKAIANDVIENQEKINHHGKRADAIVKGMLQHSKTSTGKKEPTDINKLADEYLRLAYHGLRAKDKSFNAEFKTDFDESIGKINIVPQDIGRVLLNLYNNAFYAVNEKKQKLDETFDPVVSVSTKKENGNIIITIHDNGPGIPQNIIDKIFQPFFTTKPTGQGTGLGLSLSYDIIKAHGGEIKVETKEDKGSGFIIQLPA